MFSSSYMSACVSLEIPRLCVISGTQECWRHGGGLGDQLSAAVECHLIAEPRVQLPQHLRQYAANFALCFSHTDTHNVSSLRNNCYALSGSPRPARPQVDLHSVPGHDGLLEGMGDQIADEDHLLTGMPLLRACNTVKIYSCMPQSYM